MMKGMRTKIFPRSGWYLLVALLSLGDGVGRLDCKQAWRHEHSPYRLDEMNYCREKLPAAMAAIGCRLSYVKEAFFIAGRVQVDAVLYSAKEQAAQTVLWKSIAKEGHGICFAPVFAIFPDLNRRATHLSRQFDQARIVQVTTVAQEYLVVLRH